MNPSKSWNAKLEAASFLRSKNLYRQCAWLSMLDFSPLCHPEFMHFTKNKSVSFFQSYFDVGGSVECRRAMAIDLRYDLLQVNCGSELNLRLLTQHLITKKTWFYLKAIATLILSSLAL